MEFNTESSPICRYCFGDTSEGELISPCKCSGGQKFVHLSCLRRWQRMILASQSTHPAHYKDDPRNHICNVCLSEYTCAPPSRAELMASYTGPEIAALLEKNRIIASRDVFSEMLEKQIQENPYIGLIGGYQHWIHGVYLITDVRSDSQYEELPFTNQSQLDQFRQSLDENLQYKFQGDVLQVVPSGSLSNVTKEDLSLALRSLRSPCKIVLSKINERSCGDDHITAVNLTRLIATLPRPGLVEQAIYALTSRYGLSALDTIKVHHFIGGPCEPKDIMACIVFGGIKQGYTVLTNIHDAMKLAVARGSRRFPSQGLIVGGQIVKVQGLVSRRDLNGVKGIALRFDEVSGRWMVGLDSGENVKVKPSNLVDLHNVEVTGQCNLFVVWGCARWSRTQLLGEIAKGDWGLCRATTADFTSDTSERWRNVSEGDRLAFAPVSEMTEDYIRIGREQMEAYRSAARLAAIEVGGVGDEGVEDE